MRSSTKALSAALVAVLAGRAHAQPAEPASPPADPSAAPAEQPADPSAPSAPSAAPADAPTDDATTDDGADKAPPAGAEADGRKYKHHKNDDGAGDKPPGDPDEDVSANDESPWDNLELSGRVYARFEAWDDDVNDWLGQMSLPSARLGVKYKWKDRLAAKISFEVRGSVRDAYVDVALTPCLTLRAGRFKLPASAIERTSTWTLPSVDRPIGSDILGGSLGVVGRNLGAALTWDPGVGVKPKVELAVSRPFDLSGLDITTGEGQRPLSEYAGLGVTLRGELEPVTDVHVGAFAQSRQVNAGTGAPSRYWSGGVDLEAESGGLRVWADAITGSGQFKAPFATDDAMFVVAQTVVGWRAGGHKGGKRYVEPYVLAAYVNPNAARKDDQLVQLGGGVAGGRWKRWRAQAQVTVMQAGDIPVADLTGAGSELLGDRLTLTTQLSAAF
jgi:hypothetical protein